MSKKPAGLSMEDSSLEMQPAAKRARQNIFARIYFRPYKELSGWEIALRALIALLIGAVVGVIIGVTVRFA